MIETILQLFCDMGYGGILFLMTIESSFIPFPSEIVIPPAAYLASQGQMNIYLIILSGTLGSIIGASINYFLALWLGRAVIYSLAEKKIAKFLLIDVKKIEKAEQYFLKYGNASTFFGRLITVIRQLISIPAGLSRMNFGSFIFYTTLGSGIWVTILSLLGYYFGENKELFMENYHLISYGLVVFACMIILLIFLKKRINRK